MRQGRWHSGPLPVIITRGTSLTSLLALRLVTTGILSDSGCPVVFCVSGFYLPAQGGGMEMGREGLDSTNQGGTGVCIRSWIEGLKMGR